MKNKLQQIEAEIKTLETRLAILRSRLPNVDYEKVIEVVCRAAGVDRELVMSKSQKELLVDVRCIICRELKDYGLSLSIIGDIIGRDHSTVSWNLNRYERLKEVHPAFRAMADTCAEAVNEEFAPIIITLAS